MVGDLPKGRLPSLIKLNILSSRVNKKEVDIFRRTHPQCTIHHGWTDSFAATVQGATRLRVRSGGTCHRRIDQEKTLAEITNTDEIELIVKSISINEEKSAFHCMCCGNPTLEFYKGEKLLAMVGYHHGQSLRWADGLWPGDGMLTTQSMDFLISWLARHGVTGPQQERERESKQASERKQQWQRLEELIPKQIFNAVIAARSTSTISWKEDPRGEKRNELVGEAFKKHERDAVTSIILYLRLIGFAGDRGWHFYDFYDPILIKHLLPRFKGKELAEAVNAVMQDEEGLRGSSRWLLGEDGWKYLDKSDWDKILPPLAEFALTSKHDRNVKKTIASLYQINSPWAVDILRRIITGPKRLNELKKRGGWIIDFGDGDKLRSNKYSDVAYAAFCLAKLGDIDSLPQIEKLAKNSEGQDKGLLEKALILIRDNRKKEDHD
jgi:hypothetical protein